jgi:hypothetical protein
LVAAVVVQTLFGVVVVTVVLASRTEPPPARGAACFIAPKDRTGSRVAVSRELHVHVRAVNAHRAWRGGKEERDREREKGAGVTYCGA